MARRHSSFLLRCWDLGSDDERIEIEHIQAGTKVLVQSVEDAVEWLCAQGDDAGTRQQAGSDSARSATSGANRGGDHG